MTGSGRSLLPACGLPWRYKMNLPSVLRVKNRPNLARVLFLGAVLLTLGLSTQSAFANGAHGSGGGGFHGGGGGFHGGGGGYHGGYGGGYHGGYGGGYHGGYGGGYHGGYGGGYHGGYGGGYHGGYGGYHGGYGYGYRGGYGYGYGGYGYGYGGFGFGLSFNFGWPWGYGYPYAYGYYPYYAYSPYYSYPYYPYPYYSGPVSYSAPVSGPSGYSDPTAYSQSSGNYPNDAPVAQPRYSVPQAAPPNSNSYTLHEATYVARPPSYRSASATVSAASYHPASAARQLPAMRPEVRNVIRALRGMPPAARQRAINSGQYSNFSPQELELVRYAANVP